MGPIEPDVEDEQAPALTKFAAMLARGLVEAQAALDEHGRGRIVAWEQDGLPPTVWAWSRCRLRLPVAWRCAARTEATARLALTPSARGPVSVTLGFRYLLTPAEGDEPPRPAPDEGARG